MVETKELGDSRRIRVEAQMLSIYLEKSRKSSREVATVLNIVA